MTENDILPWHQAAFTSLWARRDSLPHALLLHGRAGVGKLRFAAFLAQSILCENPGAAGACGTCTSCGWLAAAYHPDLQRLEPSAAEDGAEDGDKADKKKSGTQITVEQVRALSDFLGVSTHRGGWRPVLIHPTEALNMNAANALLKSLEEPPPRTVFLLVSHRLHRVLPTIKSRCQLVALPAPTPAEATEWLNAQGVANPGLAVAHSGGAPLRASELAADTYWELRGRLMRHLTGVRIDALAAAEDSLEAGVPLVLEWLQKWTYDVATRRLTGELRYNIDQQPAVDRIAGGCDPIRILRLHREITGLQRHAHHPLNARLFLEQLMMTYAEAVSGASTAS